jgi:hypothetical protein
VKIKIQIFTVDKGYADQAVRMLSREYKPDFVEFAVMRNIQEGFYIMEPYTDPIDAVYALKQIMDETKDNVGIYYVDSNKIYLRLFQNAQNAGVEYLYEDEKERFKNSQNQK